MRRSMDGYLSAGKYLGSRTFGHTGFTGELTFHVVAYDDLCLLLKRNSGIERGLQEMKDRTCRLERSEGYVLLLIPSFVYAVICSSTGLVADLTSHYSCRHIIMDRS